MYYQLSKKKPRILATEQIAGTVAEPWVPVTHNRDPCITLVKHV